VLGITAIGKSAERTSIRYLRPVNCASSAKKRKNKSRNGRIGRATCYSRVTGLDMEMLELALGRGAATPLSPQLGWPLVEENASKRATRSVIEEAKEN
jgi:hypothetical protein